jgi:hypothetical protein
VPKAWQQAGFFLRLYHGKVVPDLKHHNTGMYRGSNHSALCVPNLVSVILQPCYLPHPVGRELCGN